MQEVQLLTREDVVEIVERELRRQFQALRDEILGSFREAVVDATRNHLSGMVEMIVGQELKVFRQEILNALEEAVRQVSEDKAFPGGNSLDDYQQ